MFFYAGIAWILSAYSLQFVAVLYDDNNDMDFAIKARDILLDLEDYKMISEVVKEETRTFFAIDRHIDGLKQIYNIINKV